MRGGEEGRKHLQTNSRILITHSPANGARDCFGSSHMLLTSVVQRSTEPNMAEGEDAFEGSINKALTFLTEQGFSRELQQEQKSSVKRLFTGGDLLAVLQTGFGKSLIFQVLALAKEGCVVVVIKWGWKAYATPTSCL